MTVLGVAGYVCYRALQPYIPSLPFLRGENNLDSSHDVPSMRRRAGREVVRRSSAGNRRSINSATNEGRSEYYHDNNGNYYCYDDDSGDNGFRPRPGLFRSIFMGPKAVFDYMLAPDNV